MIRKVRRISDESWDKLAYTDKLTRYDTNLIDELIDILTPFETATMLTQGQNQVTSSIVLPCIRGLKAAMADLKDKYKSKIVSALSTSITKRLDKYEEKELFILSAVLDPRWKKLWCSPEEVTDIRDLLIRKMSTLAPEESNENETDASPPRKRSKLLSFMGAAQLSRPPRKVVSTPSLQVDMYLEHSTIDEDADPLSWWENNYKDFPQLYMMAIAYLFTPASSAPVERLFSVAGKVFRPDRCRLSDARFEELMFLASNAHLNKV